MSWVYSEADYLGIVDDAYREYDFFAKRGIEFSGRLGAYKSQKVLVAGCGWGFLVRELMEKHGFTDVWGCDASTYAVQVAAPREIAGFESRILLGDCLADLKSVRQAAGLRGNSTFAAGITEDLLPCAASVDEVATMLSRLRAACGTLAHVITPQVRGGVRQPDGRVVFPGGEQMAGFLWRTHDEWLSLIGPGEPILFTDLNEAVNV